jgi:hypothetical protein
MEEIQAKARVSLPQVRAAIGCGTWVDEPIRGTAMSKSSKVSVVSDVMLAHYNRARRVYSTREEARSMASFILDHATATAIGEPAAALGAALEAIDIALRLAATPATSDEDLSLKTDILAIHFAPLAKACAHPQVERIVAAALAAERALGSVHRRTVEVRRAGAGRGRSCRSVVRRSGPDSTPARLQAYADGAETVSEVRALLMAMHLVLEDRQALARAGRARTAVGAERFFCGLLRRLCATKPLSTEWARCKASALQDAKDDLLKEDGLLRGQAGDRALMIAMIDAAIGIDGEGWPKPSSLH